MNEFDLLDKLEQTSGKSDKERLLKNNVSSNMAELLDAALNFKRKYYIKKYDVIYPRSGNSGCRHQDFMILLSALESEKYRGDAAKNLVENFFKKCTPQQAKWYDRIIKKNLRAGFSISTAKKAGYKIPEFQVKLAKDGKKSPRAVELVNKGGYGSIKLDGYRAFSELEDDVELLSRNGTVYENFPSVIKTLDKIFPKRKFCPDGEIMSDDFQSMQMTAFAAKRGQTVGDVFYYIFDFVPYNEWRKQKFKMPLSDRLNELEKYRKTIESTPNIRIVDHVWIDNMADIHKYEKQYIQQGFEGLMFEPDIPYYVGRKSNKLMKFKTMLSQEVEVAGFYEGTGKYAGTLGGVYVVQENGQDCKVGSGFSDADRDYIWNHQSKFLGRIFEAKYQEETPDGVMRFPVFFRWRDLSQKSGKI